ncbi:MAG: tetratricopeptide repeat protein [Chthoniobacterales bacterium]
MEVIRRLTFPLLIAVFAVFLPHHARATGGDDLDTPAVTIGESLDFLPGKSLGEIFLETDAKPADDESTDLADEILKVAARLGREAPAQLLPAVDDLLARARQHYSSKGDWCNLLHDVRDVLAGSANDRKAAADYIKWRVESRQQFFAISAGGDSTDDASVDPDLEGRVATAAGPLKAHWMYLCGAQTYRSGDREACREWFQRVVKEFPNHPRAEIALFMDARCAFSESRKGVDDLDPAPPDAARLGAQKRAAGLFERYRKQYPKGRFVADVLGWLGALMCDAGRYLDALDCYIAQAETPGHPETLKSAIFMCERSLASVAAKPDGDAAFALIARHPRIAMGFTYLVLSAREADNYDGKFDRPADVKKWRRAVLPRIAAAVTRQKERYKSGDWQPRYLAMLAQAASASGNQDQALQITNLSPADLERSDDLLLVRAIAFQRAGKAADAIATYRQLLAGFPNAPTMPGVRLRLALALQDNHEAGAALVELTHLLPKSDAASPALAEAQEEESGDDGESAGTGGAPEATSVSPYTAGSLFPLDLSYWSLKESAVYPNITGADLEQVQVVIDTLLNFAPLTELATGLSSAEFNEASRKKLRATLAERYLARESFAEAKPFMPPGQIKLAAEKLETLTKAATGSGPEKAEAMSQLGDAWAEARGKLLRVPLDAHGDWDASSGRDGITRRENGQSLQFKEIDTELEQRDELRHAARWWLAAARSRPGTPLSARARWNALETMPKIARASEYAEERARETKGEAVSREIYEKLRAESPDSVEAKRLAAYWSFPPPPESGDEVVYDFSGYKLRDAHIMGYPIYDAGGFKSADGEPNPDESGIERDVLERVAVLPEKAESMEPSQFANEIKQLADAARSKLASARDATVMNFLDDLALFSSEPNISSEMLKAYVSIRFQVLQSNGWARPGPEDPAAISDDDIRAKIDEALRNPAMQPMADYLAFSRIGLLAGERTEMKTDIFDPKDDGAPVTVKSRDYSEMEKLAGDFLKKYPQSRKREAALFVLARSVQALSRPYIVQTGVPIPGTAPDDRVFDMAEKSYQAEAFDPKRVLAALDAYDREYPKGRYAADVRNFRGMLLWRTHDWGPALDLTIEQLNDDSNRDLHAEASIRLVNIFAGLEQAEYRADLLDAIRARPLAIKYLKGFLGRASSLRYLKAYLSDQLNLKATVQNLSSP